MVAMQKLILIALFTLILVILFPALSQSTDVTAEAIGQANMRARPDVNAEQVGEIVNGTQYPVIGRSEFVPWVLLGDPSSELPLGWVFQELLTITGDLNTLPFTDDIDASQPVLPSATPFPPGFTPEGTIAPPATNTPAFTVAGSTAGEINLRYGPGVDYDRVGVAQPGERFQITARHTQLPWVQIRYDPSPNGFAWVARELLTYEGNVDSLPGISQTTFNFPTLTPTSAPVFTSVPPFQQEVQLSSSFQALGNQLWANVFGAGFDPATSRLGALYLQDMQTGEAITFGNDIAFSGTSISKVAILAELFNVLTSTPDTATAVDIANTMICSENVATNRLLNIIGGGDLLAGADRTTEFLQSLGLRSTFLAAPYDTTNGATTPTPLPRSLSIPSVESDQTRANPDFSNQLTVDEMGFLLGDIYQCAMNGAGTLMQSGSFTQEECQRMVHVMTNNNVDALLRAGVPAEVPVAHKHGWIPDTHGNAGIFFTPGGDYVMVMMLHQPSWLEYSESLPVIAETSRMVYNFYNPDTPLPEVREGFIPEATTCNFAGSPLINELTSPVFELPIAVERGIETSDTAPAMQVVTPTPQPSPSPTATLAG